MSHDYFKKFLELVKPNYEFSSSNIPIKPDYSNLYNWAATPDIDGEQFYIPSNKFEINKSNNDIDVFYIHPTGFFEKNWNSDMDKNRSAYERTEIMLANQASAFNNSCNIYAPEYRQATYYSFFDTKGNGQNALDLAYEDIENAFDYFIENFNHKKPFIIAGHSQGALHAHRLINQKIVDTELNNRFVCAYAIGYMIPDELFDNLFKSLKKSSTYNDTNCIISWCTVVEGFKRNRSKTLFWTPDGWSFQDMNKRIVSTNPFSWENNSSWYSNKTQNNSIINKSQEYDFTDRFRIEHSGLKKSIGFTRIQDFETSINKESGLVEAKGPLIDNIKKMSYFNGDLHSFDVMLFWGALRQNIKKRIDAFS